MQPCSTVVIQQVIYVVSSKIPCDGLLDQVTHSDQLSSNVCKIAAFALFAPMMAVVLFLLGIDIVNALRENRALGQRQTGSICFRKCCSSKCDGQFYGLKGDLEAQLKFQDCQVEENKPFEIGEVTKCRETCNVSLLGESKAVKVLRNSGKGEQQCTLEKGQKEMCEGSCCIPKCNGNKYELKADLRGKYELQDCQLNKQAFVVEGYAKVCEETCTGHKKTVKVWRKSGRGSPQCAVQGLGVKEMALDFVKQLEVDALKLTDGNYHHLPLMKPHKVQEFLRLMGKEVLKPEHSQHGYSVEINSTKHVVIIGDLHGQLFNLIGFLFHTKEYHKDESFQKLRGSKLLYCDPGLQYVFMGDYVDRGERGLELLLLVLAYKVRNGQIGKAAIDTKGYL